MDGKFDFVAPQFLESLPEAANMVDQDGADSFFDTAFTTPMKSMHRSPETFHTPFGEFREKTENLMTDEEEITGNLVTDEVKKTTENLMTDEVKETTENLMTDEVKETTENLMTDEVEETTENLMTDEVKETTENLMTDEVKDQRKIKKAKRCLPTNRNIKSGALTLDGVVPIELSKAKLHGMMTRQDITKSPSLELRSRQISREDLKRKASPSDHRNLRHTSKFMSLAEKIMHFQVDTPPRFKSKLAPIEEKKLNFHLKPTIPNSPKLMTKTRVRQHETEAEAKQENYVFKASELNSKIFEKPSLSDRPKAKPSTVFKPFNLTEVPKKEPAKEEVFQFKAKPAPKWLGSSDSLNCSAISNCSRRSRRRGISTTDDELTMENDGAYSGMSLVLTTNSTTEIKPFSFDERDKELLKKKEEKMIKSKEVSSNFKANLPSVLFKEPFLPQKPNRPALEPLKIELNTERRARKRQEFDKELSLKNERREEERKKVLEELEQYEQMQIKELRKQLVHKAQPVPKFIN